MQLSFVKVAMLASPALLSILLASQVGTVAAVPADPNTVAEPTYPACDANQKPEETKSGTCHAWEPKDSTKLAPAGSEDGYEKTKPGTVKYIPGTNGKLGACGLGYTDSSNIICVNPGWLSFAKNGSNCNRWAEVKYGDKTVEARIVDSCTEPDCNGLFLSKRIFEYFGGPKAIVDGHLPNSVEWKVLKKEPFWACLAGLPGTNQDLKTDDCQGEDDNKCPRDGRKHGADRIVGAKAYDKCPSSPNPYACADGHKLPLHQN